jgi:hypothetical protein
MKTKFHKIPVFWYRWLLLVSIGIMIFGLSMVVMPGLIMKFFSFIVYSKSDLIQSEFNVTAVKYIELTHGVLGAVMFGWSILLLMIIIGPFRNGNIEGWYYLTVSIIAWFVPDTLFSLWKGFWQNAILNSLLGLFLVLPLLGTYKAFKKHNKQ